MGAQPVPPYATIYFAIHEIILCPQFPSLVFYRRYIEDTIGIWRRNPDPVIDLANWTKFQEAMNSYGILTWDPFTQELCLNFMDLTISYDPSTSALVFTVYQKKENFYLYLPTRSCHAPGIIYGTILGTLFRYKKSAPVSKTFIRKPKSFFTVWLTKAINHPNFNYYLPRPLRNFLRRSSERNPNSRAMNSKMI